jgi:ubiquinone/menaquinone biosynthesis C-methylase UbiE
MIRLRKRLTRLAMPLVLRLLDSASTPRLKEILMEAIRRRALKLSPAEGLRFMFELDADLYALQGHLAVLYGDGVHTKHRHMRYHDFFWKRVNAGETVLDIGCGNGALTFDVADRGGAQVCGIDLSEQNIASARERYAHPNVTYVVGDALTALPGTHFDVVIMSNVLEHLPGRPEFLRRVQATLTPQRFLIRVPVFERD